MINHLFLNTRYFVASCTYITGTYIGRAGRVERTYAMQTGAAVQGHHERVERALSRSTAR